MKHLYVRIYAFIAMLTIFFVVGVFVFHIVDDINREIDNAKITFHKFEKAVAHEVKRNLLEDEASKQRLRGVARALDLRGFVIQIAPDAGMILSYPSDSNLFAIVNGNVLIRENSKFLKVFKTEGYATIADNQKKIYITAMMNIFPSNMVFIRSRTVFFFALALILLTGLIRILLSVNSAKKEEKVYTTFNEKFTPSRHSYGEYETPTKNFCEEFSDMDITDDERAFTSIKDIGTNSLYDENPISNDSSLDFSSNDNFSNTSSHNNLNEEPKGLYSPATGFGWKEYLPERLKSEIERATATDQDMSFVIIKIQDVDFSSLNMDSISNIVLEAFKFRDMVFEYSDDITLGFAGILQDMYIDRAWKICNSLFLALKGDIYLTGQEPTIGIGITTRACRLADERIMINEAEGAVSHALQNKNDPIVGFKPNAEKYREQAIEERY